MARWFYRGCCQRRSCCLRFVWDGFLPFTLIESWCKSVKKTVSDCKETAQKPDGCCPALIFHVTWAALVKLKKLHASVIWVIT